jgi:RNA polymerase sigma-70 factor, ECF subfamily
MIGAAKSALDASPSGAKTNLDALYREHTRDVARWIAHLGGPSLDVEDLVHEVFMVVQRRLPEFRGEAKVTTWLYRITEHVVANARRRERFRRWTRRTRRLEIIDAVCPYPADPGAALESDQARRTVYAALDRLPEKHRTLLILFEIEGLSGEQIAELRGVRRETLWVQIHRARSLFLDVLKDAGVTHVATK